MPSNDRARPRPSTPRPSAGEPRAPAVPPHAGWDGDRLHHVGRPRIEWSRTELLHLTAGVLAITLCFAFLRSREREVLDKVVSAVTDPWLLLACFLAVSSGFVLHEFAHKVLAQRYGHWAEFRASPLSLVIGVVLALFASFFVAAPGAVWIQGRPPPRQYGLISIVGPGVNVVVCLIAFGAFMLLKATNPSFGLDRDLPLEFTLALVAVVNGFLAVFNLLPVSLGVLALDGRKVWWWSKRAWLASFVLALALFAWVYVEVGAPLFPLS